MSNAMNTNQVKSLRSMTVDFLERAQSYLEQAEACGVAVHDVRESKQKFEETLERIDDERTSYSQLAHEMLGRVEHILHVLEVDGRPDPRLADDLAAVRNSARLLEAVCSSQSSAASRSFKGALN